LADGALLAAVALAPLAALALNVVALALAINDEGTVMVPVGATMELLCGMLPVDAALMVALSDTGFVIVHGQFVMVMVVADEAVYVWLPMEKDVACEQ